MPEEIIGNYKLARLIGQGQTSQVYEVIETNSGRHFAMKLLLPEKVADKTCRNMLLHEARVGKLMAHPNVIRIVHIDPRPDNPHFVMEFFPSGALTLRIRNDRPFLIEKGHEILKQAATAFAYVNAQGWVHRDIKPDNILVNSLGEAKVIDFALAWKIPTGLSRWFYRRGKSQGTRSYMSPEQIRGQLLDGRADIYSFGITAFEMVVGRPPFRGSTPQDLLVKHITEKPLSPAVLNPAVTNEFADLVLRMLAKKKEERPRDFHEVLMALRTMKVFKDEPAPASNE
jgi:serine/threonine-protein kinase